MNVLFGFYTLTGLAIGVLVPVSISLVRWSLWMYQVRSVSRRPIEPGVQGFGLPRHLMAMLFSGQHYAFPLLQPLDWAFPWMILLSVYTVTGGVLLDNGFSIGIATGVAMLVVFLGWLLYYGRFIDDDTAAYPAWYQTDLACFISVYVAGLGGAAVDTWLF